MNYTGKHFVLIIGYMNLNSLDWYAIQLQIYLKSEDSNGGQFAFISNES